MATRSIARGAGAPPAPVPVASGGLARLPGGIPRALPAYLLLLTVLVAHVVLLLGVFPALREDIQLRGSLRLFFLDSSRTLSGAVPYRDFLLEYPPGSLLVMVLPNLFAPGFLAYRAAYFVEMTILDCIMVATLFAIARTARLSTLRVLGLYTAGILLLGPMIEYRLDLAPAVLTALTILAWQRRWMAPAALVLAAGVATKAYPLILLPPLVFDAWREGGVRRLATTLLTFVVALGAFLGPLLLAGSEGIANALRFQLDRHLQVESIWATIPLLAHRIGGFPLEVVGRERALVVLGPGDAAGQQGTLVLIVVTVAVYARWGLRRRGLRRRGDARGLPTSTDLALGDEVAPEPLSPRGAVLVGPRMGPDMALFAGSATLLLAVTLLSKVLSPQYLLWALPGLAMLPLRSWRAIVAVVLFLAALPLTQWIYPLHYGELVRLITPRAVGVLALRNLLLVLAFIALLSLRWGDGRRPQRRVMPSSLAPPPSLSPVSPPISASPEPARPRPSSAQGRGE